MAQDRHSDGCARVRIRLRRRRRPDAAARRCARSCPSPCRRRPDASGGVRFVRRPRRHAAPPALDAPTAAWRSLRDQPATARADVRPATMRPPPTALASPARRAPNPPQTIQRAPSGRRCAAGRAAPTRRSTLLGVVRRAPERPQAPRRRRAAGHPHPPAHRWAFPLDARSPSRAPPLSICRGAPDDETSPPLSRTVAGDAATMRETV